MKPLVHHMGITLADELIAGMELKRCEWKCLNPFRSGERTKLSMARWVITDNSSLFCRCGHTPQDIAHLLTCPLLKFHCSLIDLANHSDLVLLRHDMIMNNHFNGFFKSGLCRIHVYHISLYFYWIRRYNYLNIAVTV